MRFKIFQRCAAQLIIKIRGNLIWLAIHFGLELFHEKRALSCGDSSLHEFIAHCFAGAKETVLYGPERQAGNFRNLVVAQIVSMSQHDQFAVSSRQCVHNCFDLIATFFSFAFLLRRQPAALDVNFAPLAIDVHR